MMKEMGRIYSFCRKLLDAGGLGLGLVSGFILSMIACASAPKPEEHRISKMLFYNLHSRRPDRVGAEPFALPGEREYESHPRPDSRFDCELYIKLMNRTDLNAVRSCLTSFDDLKEALTVTYILNREIQPRWKIEDEKTAPACLKASLMEIPVPREIFFQSNEEGQLRCYNARIPIKDEEGVGIKSFFHKTRMKLVFPLPDVPKTDHDLIALLANWSLGPFWDATDNTIPAKTVPDDICRKCMGDQMFSNTDPIPPLWPSLE